MICTSQHKYLLLGFWQLHLVMLAVMPLFNNNNTIANAQGYNGYNSYYSQYPTDDKKYECRTGPLEGFFTSSVEFCKFKFDDSKKDRDGNTGPQGAQGIQGPIGHNGTQGPRGFNGTNGEQGPPGITQINTTNAYSVNSTLTVNNATSSNVGRANCDSGDFVIEGGYTIFTTIGGAPFELLERPIFSPLGSGWEVALSPSTERSIVSWTTHAICFDNPPPHTP